MKKINPDDIKKVNAPFEVPKDYFEDLEKNIQDRITTPSPSVIRPRLRLALIPALLIVVISSVIVVTNLRETGNAKDDLLAQVSDDEILAYLEFNNISEYDIATLTDEPGGLIPDEVNYLEELELEDENLDDLLNEFGLDNEYL